MMIYSPEVMEDWIVEMSPEQQKAQNTILIGAVLCIFAGILSFFLDSFSESVRTAAIAVLVICIAAGLILVGIGIRKDKQIKDEQARKNGNS